MKKQRISNKLLSFLMSVLILAVSIPTYAFASLIDFPLDEKEAEAVEVTENEASFEKSEVYVLLEDEALRTENTKHFKLSNGTVKAVSYAQPVHYMDEDGNWIDIDNALTLNGNEYSAKNKQEIKFANKSGSTGLISIKDGEYKIDFTPLNTNKVRVEIENPQESNSRKFDDVKKLNNLVSTATYKNIYNGIDLEYILVGNNIKENIIVNEKQNSYVFSFEIKLNKLNAELVNNAIILTDYDTGEQVYEIPAPYMLDANGEYSSDVEYTLTKNNKWKYTLTVSANPEWINDEEREFPVRIDPTILANPSEESVVDTFIMDNFDYSGFSYMIVGNFSIACRDIPGFIKFNSYPILPEGNILLDVMLDLFIPGVDNSKNVSFSIGVYEAKAGWENNGAQPYDSTKQYSESTEIDCVPILADGAYSWNVTSLYEKWNEENGVNNGICIKTKGLSENDVANVRILTSEHNEKEICPNLEMTYISPIGVEEYYAYAQNTLGEFGESYVNLYNGSLTYINRLTSIEIGENLTYDINMVYNSIEKKWKPSFEESLKLYDEDGIERYIWTDADGTPHWFTPYLQKNYWGVYVSYEELSNGNLVAMQNPMVFYPEDDIDYVLVQVTENEFVLRDYQGNQRFFDCEGKLTKICNSLGDMLYFYYIKQSNNESQIPRLSSIAYKSVNGTLTEQIRFEYTASFYNKLCYIYNIQSQDEINISWSTTKKIDSISYNIENLSSTENINFNYSTNGFLKTATDSVTQDKLDFSMYTSGKHFGISTFSNNIKEKEYTIQYNTSNTTVVDCGTNLGSENDNFIYVIYQFDAKGRKLTATFGNEATNYIYDDSILPNNLYYSVIYHQNIFKEPFNSADEVATYFAMKYYRSSFYIRHEYGAIIYSITHNNTTTYNFTNIVYGGVHNVSINFDIKIGGAYVGDIHTHPFDNEYSEDDKKFDTGYGYLVVPALQIKKFNYTTQIEDNFQISFSPNELTNREREFLRERFEASWRAHVSNNCTALSDCDNNADQWPREIQQQ